MRQVQVKKKEKNLVEGKDVSGKNILKQALLDVRLDADEALSKLNDEEAIEEVRTKQDYWKGMGISSVPTIVFNRKNAVTGAQPVNALKKFISEML